ncbi:MAG: response regulator [Chloroflexi bacterium]|nr:response regulator [Chloroflexota bacterium]MDA1002887.1 response regulator [Chloroflexota bacterium]
MAAAITDSDPKRARSSVPTILVAEDEESVRSMIALVLRSRGYRTILCADGREAVSQLEAGVHVDAVLMDIRMPRLGGIELVTFIRQQPELASLPVVAMSAYNDQRQEREVLSAGADAFLAKPFTVNDLSDALEALLGPRKPRA